MESIQIRGGQCVFTDNEIHIEISRLTFLKQFAEKRPILTGFLALTFSATLIGAVSTLLMLFLFNRIPYSIFEIIWQVTAISGLIFAGSLFVWFIIHISYVKYSRRIGAHTKNLSNEDTIPHDLIELVTFKTIGDTPMMFIHYRRQGENIIRPVYFLKGKPEIEQASAAFRSLSIPIKKEEYS